MIYDYQNIIYTILALWICCSLRQSDEGTGGRTRAPVWRPDGSKLFRTWLEEVHEWITANPTMTTQFTENALRRSMKGSAKDYVHTISMSEDEVAKISKALDDQNRYGQIKAKLEPTSYLLKKLKKKYAGLLIGNK